MDDMEAAAGLVRKIDCRADCGGFRFNRARREKVTHCSVGRDRPDESGGFGMHGGGPSGGFDGGGGC